MPTYDYQCTDCNRHEAVFQTISQYCASPQRPECCGHTMERKLSVNPLFSGLANAMAGDRHYENMQASDGTDISTRTKHREYMKRTGLTTMDDFSGTWKKAGAERTALRDGTFQDDHLRSEVTKQVVEAMAKPD